MTMLWNEMLKMICLWPSLCYYDARTRVRRQLYIGFLVSADTDRFPCFNHHLLYALWDRHLLWHLCNAYNL